MLFDEKHEELREGYKARVKETLISHIETQLRPTVEELRSIAARWAPKHFWTASECAILLVGADPHNADVFTDTDFPKSLVPKGDRDKFDDVLDGIHRRFGDKVAPSEACEWAASRGMRHEYLEQALAGIPKLRIANELTDGLSKVRKEDITKRDKTRSQLIWAAADRRGFRDDQHNGAVQLFKQDLEKIGHSKDEETIRDAIVTAKNHALGGKSFAECVADKQESRKAVKRSGRKSSSN